nr:acyltransferase [uncultured Roseateles sp.]
MGENKVSPVRLIELDAAKGLAISLVVWGHIVARDFAKPLGNEWYFAANARLYEFHMAFFFFLAGCVYFLNSNPSWWWRWKKTASRLVPAYVIFAGAVYLLKVGASSFMKVDAPLSNALGDFGNQILYPSRGAAQYLWFIVVLLEMQVAAPLLLRLVGQRIVWALAISLCLHLMAISELITEVFALRWLCRYLLFFLIGAFFIRHRQNIWPKLDRWRWPLIASFLLVLVFAPKSILPTLGALLSLAALMAVVRYLCSKNMVSWLTFLGINSFTIYLMNSLAMGLGRALIVRAWGWDGWKFIIVVFVLWGIGLTLPVLVQRYFFSRFHFLNKITR